MTCCYREFDIECRKNECRGFDILPFKLPDIIKKVLKVK